MAYLRKCVVNVTCPPLTNLYFSSASRNHSMQQTTMAFITINLQLTWAVMTEFIVSIDFFFGLILNEDCKWILLDEADAPL